jgi:hypothetical protein
MKPTYGYEMCKIVISGEAAGKDDLAKEIDYEDEPPLTSRFLFIYFVAISLCVYVLPLQRIHARTLAVGANRRCRASIGYRLLSSNLYIYVHTVTVIQEQQRLVCRCARYESITEQTS